VGLGSAAGLASAKILPYKPWQECGESPYGGFKER
jgi:hypothetical protein